MMRRVPARRATATWLRQVLHCVAALRVRRRFCGPALVLRGFPATQRRITS